MLNRSLEEVVFVPKTEICVFASESLWLLGSSPLFASRPTIMLIEIAGSLLAFLTSTRELDQHYLELDNHDPN